MNNQGKSCQSEGRSQLIEGRSRMIRSLKKLLMMAGKALTIVAMLTNAGFAALVAFDIYVSYSTMVNGQSRAAWTALALFAWNVVAHACFCKMLKQDQDQDF